MRPRLLDEQLRAAIIDLCWRVTPYGEDDEGNITHYLVTAGTVHRLIGAAQGAGIPAAFRNIGTEGAGE